MKKLLFFIFTIHLLSLNEITFSQSGWFWLNPIPQGNDLLSLFAFDSNTVIAAGRESVLKTSNGGETWKSINIDYRNQISSLYFINEQTGYAINSGNLSKTIDGGANWVNIYGGPYVLRNAYFINESTGFVCGSDNHLYYSYGLIMKTIDGGANWNLVYFSPNPFYYHYMSQVQFTDLNTGFAFGTVRLKSTDGGSNWFSLPGVGSLGTMVNNDIGYSYYAYDSTMQKTINGGLNWTTLTRLPGVFSMSFKSIDKGIAVGESGNCIFKTIDGGMSWSNISTNSPQDLKSLVMISDSKGIAVGNYGTILVSSDDFGIWTNKLKGFNYTVKYLASFNNSTLLAICQEGKILKSTNLGVNWSLKYDDTTSFFIAGAFSNNSYIAVGKNAVILRSSDEGETWNLIPSPYATNLNSILFVNGVTGYIVGNIVSSQINFPAILKTTNSGMNWFAQTNNLVGENLYDVTFLNDSTIYACGTHGKLLKTSNGGGTWINSTLPSTLDFNKIYFINSQTGFCGGLRYLLRTTNGGTSWVSIDAQINPNQCYVTDIKFHDLNTGYLTGIYCGYLDHSSGIYKTTNSGMNWYRCIDAPLQNILYNICIKDDSVIYAGGMHGTILKTNNNGGSTTNIGQENFIADDFSLSQNYPNPFNPSTTIKYNIGKPSFVKLVIYDNVGREVKKLVNEFANSGSHDICWDASSFSSGIYFYKIDITQGSSVFSDTKRMLLLK